jgi:cytochrome oxidase Cu insertion factor (SCO1/SenC/PrrC family)
MKGQDDRERTRFVVSLMVGALAFSFLQFTAGAAGLDTFRALPAAQQRPAPAFTLPDQHGTPLRLVDLRGKVVVVRFWVTW